MAPPPGPKPICLWLQDLPPASPTCQALPLASLQAPSASPLVAPVPAAILPFNGQDSGGRRVSMVAGGWAWRADSAPSVRPLWRIWGQIHCAMILCSGWLDFFLCSWFCVLILLMVWISDSIAACLYLMIQKYIHEIIMNQSYQFRTLSAVCSKNICSVISEGRVITVTPSYLLQWYQFVFVWGVSFNWSCRCLFILLPRVHKFLWILTSNNRLLTRDKLSERYESWGYVLYLLCSKWKYVGFDQLHC
jgi:hypothetical protein